jgi:hypothetical protein
MLVAVTETSHYSVFCKCENYSIRQALREGAFTKLTVTRMRVVDQAQAIRRSSPTSPASPEPHCAPRQTGIAIQQIMRTT